MSTRASQALDALDTLSIHRALVGADVTVVSLRAELHFAAPLGGEHRGTLVDAPLLLTLIPGVGIHALLTPLAGGLETDVPTLIRPTVALAARTRTTLEAGRARGAGGTSRSTLVLAIPCGGTNLAGETAGGEADNWARLLRLRL